MAGPPPTEMDPWKTLCYCFGGPQNHRHPHVSPTSHHPSSGNIPDSLGGPSCKLTQFPIGGLTATCVCGVRSPEALRRTSDLAHCPQLLLCTGAYDLNMELMSSFLTSTSLQGH